MVLVDGRRVDNPATELFGDSSVSASKGMTDLDQVTNIENVERWRLLKDRAHLYMEQMLPAV